MSEEVPEWKKSARAMKAAADETGVDFMTSPLSDIVDALLLASGEQPNRYPPPPKVCALCGERLPLNPGAFRMAEIADGEIVGWHAECAK